MDPLEQLGQTLSRGRVVVLAGAGLQMAAGVAPPEAIGGLYDRFDPVKCATPEALRRTPEIAWRALRTYLMLNQDAAARVPRAHQALATLEQLGLLRGTISTTTGGLLRAAGCARVAELFGAIDRLRCQPCARLTPHTPTPLDAPPPRCPECDAPLRPDMVLFGEPMPRAPRERAASWVYGGRALLVLGANIVRPPLRKIPVEMRQEGGRTFAIGDVDEDALGAVGGVKIEGEMVEVLPRLVGMLGLG